MKPEEPELMGSKEYRPKFTYLLSDQAWEARLQRDRRVATSACIVCSIIGWVGGIIAGLLL